MSDLVLNREDIGEVAVETFRPKMAAVFAINELAGNAHMRACFSDTSLQQKIDSELLSNLLRFYWLVFVNKCAVARHHEES